MQQAVFESLVDMIRDRSGISIKEGKKSMVSARIAKRLRTLQIEDEQDYLDRVKHDADEMIELLNVISTNTTHFFREAAHFDHMRNLIQQWVEAGEQRLRIWCAASSTGEEPYTITMTIMDLLQKLNQSIDWKLLATDISTNVLAHAQAGSYFEDELENVPDLLRKRYFKRGANKDGRAKFEAREELKSRILFRRLNLNTPPFPLKGPLDIVFCRNVMIYFDAETKIPLLRDIFRLLKPGGYLYVSHTESLTGLTADFKRVGPSIYQKPA